MNALVVIHYVKTSKDDDFRRFTSRFFVELSQIRKNSCNATEPRDGNDSKLYKKT